MGATRFTLLGCLLLLALPACADRPAPAGSPGLVAVDDRGDTLRMPAPARRIASLIPATTELLFALGMGGQVVGRTTWCDFPAAAAAVPDLGDGLQPNLEAILSVHPDLVVLYNSAQNVAAADRLREQGIPTALLNTDRLADVPRIARLLADLGGRPAAGDSLAAWFDQALAAATRPAREPAPTVLLLAWNQPPIVIGAGSFLSELLTRAGATNAFGDVTAASAPVSLEAIASRRIDLVLVLGTEVPDYAERPEWQSVPAVRERRFVFVPDAPFSRPGPRSPGALAQLNAALDAGPTR